MNYPIISKSRIFIKNGLSKKLTFEFEKSKLAANIGANSKLFYVPKIIDFKKNTGTLEFEYIEELKTINECLVKDDTILPIIFDKLGKSLAIVHTQLVLPSGYKNYLPVEWIADEYHNIFVHGDLTIDNVCVDIASQTLVIVDWSTAPILKYNMTYGSRFFDIHWFISSIFLSTTTKYKYDLLKSLVNIFVDSYKKQTGMDFSLGINNMIQTKLLNREHFRQRLKKRSLINKIPFFIRMKRRNMRLTRYYK